VEQDAAWQKLLEEGKREGTVVILGPPIAEVREGLQQFTAKYGIQVEYLAGAGGQHLAKLRPERAAGRYTADVFVGGPGTVVDDMYPEKMLAPMAEHLVLPDAAQCGNWATPDGCPWWLDPDKTFVLRLGNGLSLDLYINTRNVREGTIKNWSDLLGPQFKGRMSTWDPSGRGPGSETARYVISRFGEDFARQLYIEQQVALSTDNRQLAEWLARGTYDISINPSRESLERLVAEGLPVAHVEAQDGPGYISGGWIGAISKIDGAPHPNAAAVTINWLVSKEGAEMLGRATQFSVARKDVANDWIPPYAVPKPNVQYPDHHSWQFIKHDRDELDKIREKLFPR